MSGYDDNGGRYTFEDMLKYEDKDDECHGMNVVSVGDITDDTECDIGTQMGVQGMANTTPLKPSSGQ